MKKQVAGKWNYGNFKEPPVPHELEYEYLDMVHGQLVTVKRYKTKLPEKFDLCYEILPKATKKDIQLARGELEITGVDNEQHTIL